MNYLRYFSLGSPYPRTAVRRPYPAKPRPSVNAAILSATQITVYNEVGSGGVLCGGVVTPAIIYHLTAESGIACGGLCHVNVEYSVNTTGGCAGGSSSEAHCQFSATGSGGASCSATADCYAEFWPELLSVGILASGRADVSLQTDQTASGGSTVSGESSPQVIKTADTTGGVVISGQTVVQQIFSETSSSGCACDGTSDTGVSMHDIGVGGAVTAGTVTSQLICHPAAAGGSVVSGTGTVSYVASPVTTGGCLVHGQAGGEQAYDESGSGGCSCAGSIFVTSAYHPASLGGMLCSGGSVYDQNSSHDSAGGSVLSGIGTVNYVASAVTAGGCFVQGQAESEQTYDESGSGGCSCAASIFVTSAYYPASMGGTFCSGGSDYNQSSSHGLVSGVVAVPSSGHFQWIGLTADSSGCSGAGTSDVRREIYETSSAGIVTGGSAALFKLVPFEATSGGFLSPSSAIGQFYSPETAGGALLTGDAEFLVVRTFFGTQWVTCAGSSSPSHATWHVGSSGSVVLATSDTSFVFTNTDAAAAFCSGESVVTVGTSGIISIIPVALGGEAVVVRQLSVSAEGGSQLGGVVSFDIGSTRRISVVVSATVPGIPRRTLGTVVPKVTDDPSLGVIPVVIIDTVTVPVASEPEPVVPSTKPDPVSGNYNLPSLGQHGSARTPKRATKPKEPPALTPGRVLTPRRS